MGLDLLYLEMSLTFTCPCLSLSLSTEEGETFFQVKKSTQSRRLMKQKKAEKRAEKRRGKEEEEEEEKERDEDEGGGRKEDEAIVPRLQREKQPTNVIEKELDIKFKDTLPQKRKEEEERTWTLSGREAEALHMEEEDDDDDGDDGGEERGHGGGDEGRKKRTSEPLRDLLQSGFFPVRKGGLQGRKNVLSKREALKKISFIFLIVLGKCALTLRPKTFCCCYSLVFQAAPFPMPRPSTPHASAGKPPESEVAAKGQEENTFQSVRETKGVRTRGRRGGAGGEGGGTSTKTTTAGRRRAGSASPGSGRAPRTGG